MRVQPRGARKSYLAHKYELKAMEEQSFVPSMHVSPADMAASAGVNEVEELIKEDQGVGVNNEIEGLGAKRISYFSLYRYHEVRSNDTKKWAHGAPSPSPLSPLGDKLL